MAARRWTAENDYGIDRDAQRRVSFSAIREFGSQDFMATEPMGPIYDRSEEHLGTTDVAVIRMRAMQLTPYLRREACAGRRRAGSGAEERCEREPGRSSPSPAAATALGLQDRSGHSFAEEAWPLRAEAPPRPSPGPSSAETTGFPRHGGSRTRS